MIDYIAVTIHETVGTQYNLSPSAAALLKSVGEQIVAGRSSTEEEGDAFMEVTTGAVGMPFWQAGFKEAAFKVIRDSVEQTTDRKQSVQLIEPELIKYPSKSDMFGLAYGPAELLQEPVTKPDENLVPWQISPFGWRPEEWADQPQ